jgi:hypothetical protein
LFRGPRGLHFFGVLCLVADPAGIFESRGYAELGQDNHLEQDPDKKNT